MNSIQVLNLFSSIIANKEEEIVDKLLQNENIVIERIVSYGQSTPESYWYNQDKDEWVILLSGSATLIFKENNATVEMKPGDYLLIPAYCQHRVEKTATSEISLWLAIFF